MRTVSFVAAASALLFASPAAAQTPPSPPTAGVVDQVLNCASVTADAERLACYDAAVGRMRTAQQSGDLAVIDRAGAAVVQRESFGFSLPNLARILPFGRGDGDRPSAEPERIAEQTFVLARISQRTSTQRVFFTENGQTWVQIDQENTRLIRQGDTVTIRRGAVGSYLLIGARGGPAIRVRREE